MTSTVMSRSSGWLSARLSMTRGGWSALATLLLMAQASMMLTGCQRSTGDGSIWPEPFEAKTVLGPGDALEVRFRYWPELDEAQTVRPDGKISLQLVDEVYVAGKTPEELDAMLTEEYDEQLVNPDLTVLVRSLLGQRIYVGGAVTAPGLVVMTGPMSVLQAVMEAGGFDVESANARSVVVIRQVAGQRYARQFDIKQLLQAPSVGAVEVARPHFLAPNDVVFVSRTRITRMNRFIDQYINRMIPTVVGDVLLFEALDDDDDGGSSGSSSN